MSTPFDSVVSPTYWKGSDPRLIKGKLGTLDLGLKYKREEVQTPWKIHDNTVIITDYD